MPPLNTDLYTIREWWRDDVPAEASSLGVGLCRLFVVTASSFNATFDLLGCFELREDMMLKTQGSRRC
jgi:hypothetical protein